MKKLFFIFVALCSFAVSAKAQHYNEILLFIEVGKTIDDASYIVYLHFDSDGNACYEKVSKSTAQDRYARGVLEEYGVNKKHNIKRNHEISSSKCYVYSSGRYESQPITTYGFGGPLTQYYSARVGTDYWAIEYGGEGLIMWYQKNNSSEVRNKKYYKRIKASDLERKTPKYDFLN